jgi:hypothetical protein
MEVDVVRRLLLARDAGAKHIQFTLQTGTLLFGDIPKAKQSLQFADVRSRIILVLENHEVL